jgi:hypothetical protein
MIRYLIATVVLLSLTSFHLPAADPAAVTDEESQKKKLEPAHMKSLAEAIGAKPGVTTGPVHTLTLPRTDLEVRTLEMGDIPVEAGLATTLRVFRCHCGKYFVVGEFCTVDYESNDVIDSLRKGQFQIASVAPMLIQEKPKIVLIRFQGEGQIEQVTATLKDAVQWIGENRTKPNPLPKE